MTGLVAVGLLLVLIHTKRRYRSEHTWPLHGTFGQIFLGAVDLRQTLPRAFLHDALSTTGLASMHYHTDGYHLILTRYSCRLRLPRTALNE
jgi:hypothetical protein